MRDALVVGRVRAGWTQEEAAKEFGVTTATLSKWETGFALPTRGRTVLLALKYGLDPYELLAMREDAIQERREARTCAGT